MNNPVFNSYHSRDQLFPLTAIPNTITASMTKPDNAAGKMLRVNELLYILDFLSKVLWVLSLALLDSKIGF